jgi:hypothetical protein
MGRRSRKRAGSVPVAPPRRPPGPASVQSPTPAQHQPPRAASYKSRREDAPKPAWAPFPLTELCMLLAIVLLGLGFVTHGDRRGVLLGGGVVLITLSAGELAVREHFAGYRSHSSLLAGLCALAAGIPVWLLPVPQELVLAVGILAFAGAFAAFRRAFIRRSGGVGFRT